MDDEAETARPPLDQDEKELSMITHHTSRAALLTLLAVAGCASTQEEETGDAAESQLTQSELETNLVSQGYVHKSSDTYKVEYKTIERSAASGMICVLNNSEWAFGRNCYFVYQRHVENIQVITRGERYEHPDGRIAYALDGIQIGPVKLGPHPIVGKWSRRTEGLDPAWQCDAWSNFNVDVLDFRLDHGVKVRLNVSGGRFPVPWAPAIESELFGVEQELGSYDVTDEQVVVDKTKTADGDTGTLKLAIRSGGKFRLSLGYKRAAAESAAPSFGTTLAYEGIDQEDNCPIVQCDAAKGSRVVAPTSAPVDVDGARLQCGPFRTQSGVPAFLLPVWDPSRNACTFDRSLLVYRLSELEPNTNPYSYCPNVASGLPPRGPLRIGFSDVSAPVSGNTRPTFAAPQPKDLTYGREYGFVECEDEYEDDGHYAPGFWINGKGTPIKATKDGREYGSLTERATCNPLRVE